MTDDLSAATPGNRSGWRRWLIIAVVLAGLVGLYAWAGFRFLPGYLTRTAASYVREHYGRELQLRDVKFNPFTMELRTGAMLLPDRDGKPMLSWEKLYVNFAFWRSLGRRAIGFQDIVFTAPRVELVRRPDNIFNVLDLLPPEEPEPAKEEPPPRLIVDHFAVENGAGSYLDQGLAQANPEQVSDVDFSLRDFSTLLSGNHFDLTATAPNAKSIRLSGSFGLAPLASSGRVEIGGFELTGFMRKWMSDFRPAADSGTVDFAADYTLAFPRGSSTIKFAIPSLKASDLALRAYNADESWVRIPAVAISDTQLDVSGSQISIAAVTLERPEISARLDAEGNLNLLQYLAPEEPAASGGGTAASSESPWRVRLGEIRLDDAVFDLTSLAASKEAMHWKLTPLDLAVKDLRLPEETPVALEMTSGIEPSGKLNIQGTHDLKTGVTSLQVDATGLELASLQPAFDEQTQVEVKRGAAGLKGKLTVGGPEELRFVGGSEVTNLQVADRLNGTDLIRWRSLRAVALDARLTPLRIVARELQLQGPYAQLVIEPNGTTNLGVALSPPGSMPPANVAVEEEKKAPAKKPARKPPKAKKGSRPPPPPPPPPPPKALPVDIGAVRITNGSMNFTDRTLRPQFSTGILEMNGQITGLSGKPGSVADVTVDGKVDRYAPVTIRGNVNYFAAQTLTDLQMSFSNLEMTTFSPYSGKFAGYRIEKGKLNLTTNYRIVNNQLDAKHHFVIDQLQLGEKVESEDAVGLPLKLAVALLKDRNGVIDLELPVTGSLDDPQFRVGPIIWKMFKNLMVKIVTSPFAFIGGLFGGGDELQYVDFEPGSSALDAGDNEKLAALRKGLIERPALNLDIPMAFDASRDTEALQQVKWQEMLATAAKTRYGDKAAQPGFVEGLSGNPREQRKLMVSAYRTQFGKDPELPKPDRKDPSQKDIDPDAFAADWLEQQLKPTVVVGNDDLQALGKARADAIQDALLKDGGVEPSRVFVILQDEKAQETKPQAEGPAAAAPAASNAIRAQLTLK